MAVITRARWSFALTLLACGLLSAVAQASDRSSELAAAVDGAFRPLLEKHGVPGMAVAVTVDGQQHFFNYGVASRSAGTPVTKDTLFEIGSVSKTFTATLSSYAQALGRISLDDSPGKYMPELRGRAIDDASLLNLATYTAGGLPLQFPGTVTNSAAMVDYFQRWEPSARPGTQRQYSNPSIGLLGHVVGLAMGRSFVDLLETELLPGLGLHRSFVRVPGSATADYAWGYDKAGRPVRANPGVFDAEAYGVRSTAADLIRFVELNIRPESLGTPMRRAIEGTHVGYFRVGEMVQGLGWEQYPYPVTLERLLAGNSPAMSREANPAHPLPPKIPSDPTLFSKTGATNGFGAYVAFVPAKRIGIVMLANRNFPIPARITAAHAVLERLASGTR